MRHISEHAKCLLSFSVCNLVFQIALYSWEICKRTTIRCCSRRWCVFNQIPEIYQLQQLDANFNLSHDDGGINGKVLKFTLTFYRRLMHISYNRCKKNQRTSLQGYLGVWRSMLTWVSGYHCFLPEGGILL